MTITEVSVGRRRLRKLHPTTAFWIISLTMVIVVFTSAAPSPIYPVYQQLWGFSAFTLTVIFAVYVVALLATLLTIGSISDHVGRRPVLAVSLALLIASMAAFILADGVTGLIIARVLQGLATGALIGTLSATMLDMQPSIRIGSIANGATPTCGLALGVAVAGILVQYAPHPRFLTYETAAILIATLLIAIVVIPESSSRSGFTSRRHFAATITPSASLPRSVRPAFFAAAPALIATWSLGGLQLSLGSSIVSRILGVHNHAGAGAMLATFFATGAVAAAATSHLTPNKKLAIGYPALFVGTIFTLTAVFSSSVALFIAGAAIAGIGFGAGFSGAMSSIGVVTAPSERGQVFSTVFVVSYLGLGLPAVIAGIAVERIGLRATTIGYASYIMALVAVAAIGALRLARRGSSPAQPETVADVHPEYGDTHTAYPAGNPR